MRHEEYKQLLALEAVGSLEEGERGDLFGHLASCAGCREELRELADAAASLAYTVAPVAPPPHLRARILERVRAAGVPEIASAGPEIADRSGARGESRPTLEGARPAGGRKARALLGDFSLWQLLAGRPALGFGAAAAVLAVVLLAATTLALWSRNQSLSAEVARLYDRLRTTEGELAGQREQLASARVVGDLLASPGVRVTELSGKKPAAEARAMLAYDHSTGRAVIMASGLPPCPPGHEYQLWLIAGNKPLPGGTFKTDADGRARLADNLPSGFSAPAFAVTLEREGGVPAPEGEIYLLGSAS